MNKNITIEPISGGYIVKDAEYDITFFRLDTMFGTLKYYYSLPISLSDAYDKMFSEEKDDEFEDDDDWYW